MKYLLLIWTTLFFISCKSQQIETKTIQGDLTFRSVSYTNFYGVTEAKYQSLLKKLDSVLALPEKQVNNIELYEYVAKLVKHKIMRAPQIYLILKDDTTITVFLSESAYEKVKYFNYRDLHQEKKKVIVQLDIVEKEKGIFYAEKISSVNKIDGTSKINGRSMTFMN